MNELEHDWFASQLATYLANGLHDDERRRFEAHAQECEACASELAAAKGIEARMGELFAAVSPAADFEDRIVGRLRSSKPKRRLTIHPLVRKAAIAAAAAVVVGAVGWVRNEYVRNGKLISPEQIATNLRGWVQQPEGYGSDFKSVPATQPTTQKPTDASSIADLLAEANRLISDGKYGPALAVIDRILTHDPKNEYAKNVRPLVEDRAVIANQRQSRERFNSSVVRQFNASEEAKIPYNDILRFQDNWPDLTEKRDRTVALERDARAEDAIVAGQLERKLPEVRLDKIALSDAVEFMRDVSGANIFVDWKGLEAAGVKRDTPITARFRDVKFGDALTSILNSADGGTGKVGAAVQDGVVEISTDKGVARSGEKWDFGGGGNSAANWSGFRGGQAINGASSLTVGQLNIISGGITKSGAGALNLKSENSVGGGIVSGDAFVLGREGQTSDQPFVKRGGGVLTIDRVPQAGQLNSKDEHKALPNAPIISLGGQPTTIVQAFVRQPLAETTNGILPGYFAVQNSGTNTQLGFASLSSNPIAAFKPTEFALTIGADQSSTGASTFGNAVSGTGNLWVGTGTAQRSEIPSAGGGTAVTSSKPGIGAPIGPSPAAAMDRTTLALANTQQPTTQPGGGAAVAAQGQQAPPVAPAPVVQVRRVIRDGVMEFEVDSFDSAFAVVTKITSEEGGFVVAADSDRLQNGKVRGTITVRVPPDNLDTLILKLRALGDLKSQRLGSKDISKEYTDLESELRAGRAMENRLLEMIKTAQGEVKDLLEAEKELANWRTKIEKITGQMNYYNNLVSLATLTINAYEKDIRTPATATQSEEINAGIEAEDVDGARSAAIKAIDEVKGRIIESSLQQMNAGQFAAKIVAEVAPESAGQVVDRLRQLGKVARLDSQKKQTTGTSAQGSPSPGFQPKVEQAPTRLIISMYNLANVAPRLTTNLNLAGDDVETVYRNILKRVNDANGRVVSSNLNRQDANQISGTIQFEVKSADADAVLNDIRQPVQVLRMNVTENPDTANVTTTKQGFTVQIIPTAHVTPRLTTNLNLAAEDVEATYAAILKRLAETGGRVINSNLNRQDATQAVGAIQFEVKSTEADALLNELRKTVQVLTLNVTENTGAANVTGLKQGFSMQIIPTAQVQPREIRSLVVQTSEVDGAIQKVNASVTGAGGRVLESSLSQDAGGMKIARLALEVPLDKLESVAQIVKAQGTVRTAEASRNTQVPEGPLSRARINLTIGTGETIVPQTGGFWDTIRDGLSTSVKGLLWSMQLIIIGLCLVGPWVLMVWGGIRFAKRRKKAISAI